MVETLTSLVLQPSIHWVTSTTTTQDLKVGAAATVDGASTLTGHVSLGTTVGAAGSIYFPDWKGINFGDAAEGDLQIYHDSTHSRIADVGTGSLIISGSILSFYNQAKNETLGYPSKEDMNKINQKLDKLRSNTDSNKEYQFNLIKIK